MKRTQNEYDLHVMICTNQKEKGKSCGPKGARALVDHMKAWSKSAGLSGKIRVNQSGCLGKCESGIACVAYPKGEWALEVRPDEGQKLEEWIREIHT